MRTLQGMRTNSDYIAEQIRVKAIEETFEKFEEAVRRYYEVGYDSGETTKLYKELEKLGANMESVVDEEFRIREEVLKI